MAHQFPSPNTGPWNVDRPPADEDEAKLQQVLWNNRLYLTDFSPQRIAVLIGTRNSAHHLKHQEHCLD